MAARPSAPDEIHKLSAYAAGSLRILSRAVELYRTGEREQYRVAAVQLRLLVCDTTRAHSKIVDISLAARLLPDLMLHPPDPGSGPPVFDLSKVPLPRLDWLRCRVTLAEGGQIPLRDLIRQACDRDGGAHVDLSLHPLPDLAPWIMVTAAYLVPRLAKMLQISLRSVEM